MICIVFNSQLKKNKILFVVYIYNKFSKIRLKFSNDLTFSSSLFNILSQSGLYKFSSAISAFTISQFDLISLTNLINLSNSNPFNNIRTNGINI